MENRLYGIRGAICTEDTAEDMIKNIFNVVIDNPYILDSYIVKDIIDQYMKLYM